MSQLSSRARVELAKAALSRIGLESPARSAKTGTCGLSSPIGAIAA